jgi:hypothetical protein
MRNLFRRFLPSQPARPAQITKLRMETLDDRIVPAAFSVTALDPITENGGSQQAFIISLTGAQNSGSYSVDYTTADGTALAGSDYSTSARYD